MTQVAFDAQCDRMQPVFITPSFSAVFALYPITVIPPEIATQRFCGKRCVSPEGKNSEAVQGIEAGPDTSGEETGSTK